MYRPTPSLPPIPTVVLPGSRTPNSPDRQVRHGRHGRPPSEVRELQRTRILDAFVREVGAHGLDKAHVGRVCKAAGVSTRGFYDVFESKDQCLCEAFEVGARTICEHGLLAFEQANGRWEARVRVALHVMLGILSANPDFSRLCLVEYGRGNAAARRHFEEVVRSCREAFGGGPTRPVAGMSGEVFETVLVGSMLGPLTEFAGTGRASELVDLVTLLTYVIAAHVVGEDRARAAVRMPVL